MFYTLEDLLLLVFLMAIPTSEPLVLLLSQKWDIIGSHGLVGRNHRRLASLICGKCLIPINTLQCVLQSCLCFLPFHRTIALLIISTMSSRQATTRGRGRGRGRGSGRGGRGYVSTAFFLIVFIILNMVANRSTKVTPSHVELVSNRWVFNLICLESLLIFIITLYSVKPRPIVSVPSTISSGHVANTQDDQMDVEEDAQSYEYVIVFELEM